MNDDELSALWQQWATERGVQQRNLLMVHYTPLVRYVVSKISPELPPSLESEDLVSFGLFGLMDALDKFDLSRGFKFETYAVARIRGAIYDELRSFDWQPRSVRSTSKEIADARHSVQARLSRTADDADIADETGMTVQQVREARTLASRSRTIPLDSEMGDGLSWGECMEDRDAGHALLSVEDSLDHHRVVDAVWRLPRRHRIVVALYYYEQLTLSEIAAVLGISESRVCQFHREAIRSMHIAREESSPTTS